MEKVEVGGVVLVPVGGTILEVEWVEYDGRAWLAPEWQISNDGKMMRPTRLIAPRFAPDHKAGPGPDALQLFQSMPLTEALLERGDVPPELVSLVEVRENPAIWADAPSAMN